MYSINSLSFDRQNDKLQNPRSTCDCLLQTCSTLPRAEIGWRYLAAPILKPRSSIANLQKAYVELQEGIAKTRTPAPHCWKDIAKTRIPALHC